MVPLFASVYNFLHLTGELNSDNCLLSTVYYSTVSSSDSSKAFFGKKNYIFLGRLTYHLLAVGQRFAVNYFIAP